MASSAAHARVHESHEAKSEAPESAVVCFDLDDAVAAFDVLAQGGQYGIVGKYTYVLTARHISLLDQAGIPYHVQSKR